MLVKTVAVPAALLCVFGFVGCAAESTPVAPLELGTSIVTVSSADAALAVAGGAHEITGPTEITEPGQYRVTQDFSVSPETGDGIVVRAGGVHLDLAGHTITGPGNKVGRGVVVEGVGDVIIEGGTLRTFGIGVALLGATSTTVREITVEGGDEFADPPAVPPQIGVLLVNSARNTITETHVTGANLGYFVRGAGSYDNRLVRNAAVAGTHGLLGICYNPAMGEGPVGPSGDTVQRNSLDGFGGGIQASAGSENNRFVANTIRFREFAWEDRNGSNRFLGNRSEDLTP
jgi:hypothetical protein